MRYTERTGVTTVTLDEYANGCQDNLLLRQQNEITNEAEEHPE